MSNTVLLADAISCIDDAYLKKYFDMKEELSYMKKAAERARVVKWSVSIAACFLAVMIAIPMILNFTQHNDQAPAIKQYEAMSEVYNDLGYETLYSKLDLVGAYIGVSYKSDEEGSAVIESPLQMLIRHNYTNDASTDRVAYYVLFGKDDVKDSYIGGYDEQGLTKEFDSVTVHYSEIFDGSNHTQAKFVYESNLYVVDIVSTDEINLDYYLNLLLK